MYFVAAWGVSILGLPEGFSLPIYPAAGVALGGLISCGVRLWPGIFLGGLAFNAWFMNYVAPASESSVFKMVLTSSGMASAAVVQALVGAFLFNRFVSSPNPFNRTKDILVFIFLVAAVGCTLSSSICVTILGWAGHLPWEKFVQEGVTWWLGDVMGVLLLTPFFLVFRQPLNFQWTPARRIEVGILLF